MSSLRFVSSGFTVSHLHASSYHPRPCGLLYGPFLQDLSVLWSPQLQHHSPALQSSLLFPRNCPLTDSEPVNCWKSQGPPSCVLTILPSLLSFHSLPPRAPHGEHQFPNLPQSPWPLPQFRTWMFARITALTPPFCLEPDLLTPLILSTVHI